jgi:hypothetical protein
VEGLIVLRLLHQSLSYPFKLAHHWSLLTD